MRWRSSIAAVLALVALARPTTAEACGGGVGHSLLVGELGGDPLIGARTRERQEWESSGAPVVRSVTRALQELPPAEVWPRVAGASTREAEEADARTWFDRDAARVATYMTFVDSPLDHPVPVGTPAAAQLYRQAMGWMKRGDLTRARAQLNAVLALPPRERRWRAAWAAYMLANLEQDPTLSAAQHARVRALVRNGANDPLGLAFGSLRAEAWKRAGWDDAGHVRLCHAYRAGGGRLRCGPSTPGPEGRDSGAQIALDVLAKEHGPLQEAARDPWLATAVTAYLAYTPTPPPHPARARWMDAVEAAGTRVAPGVTAAMAALAYDRGEWARAARWARRGDPTDPRVADVRARLARRRGDTRGVIAAIRPLRYLSIAHGTWLGEAELSVGRYTDAMATFLRSGNWADAAYVAERVLTADELAAVIDRMPKVDQDGSRVDDYFQMSVHSRDWERDERYGTPDPERRDDAVILPPYSDTHASLHALLARRLARMGRWDDAARHFARSAAYVSPTHEASEIARAAAAARDAWRARAEARTPAARAEATLAFYDAVLPRRFDLLATENEPDYAQVGGYYRADLSDPRTDVGGWRTATGAAGPDERRRIAASLTERYPGWHVEPGDPEDTRLAERMREGPSWVYTGEESLLETAAIPLHLRRYHFLWPLAELAWISAEALPDADPRLVQLLCRGGRLLRHETPDTADVFYKRLVWDGRPDPVAQVADALRWFPPADALDRCVAEPWPPPTPRLNAAQRAAKARAEAEAERARREAEARAEAIAAAEQALLEARRRDERLLLLAYLLGVVGVLHRWRREILGQV